jgi:hypothetical protein
MVRQPLYPSFSDSLFDRLDDHLDGGPGNNTESLANYKGCGIPWSTLSAGRLILNAEFIVEHPEFVADEPSMDFMFADEDSDEYNGCHCTSLPLHLSPRLRDSLTVRSSLEQLRDRRPRLLPRAGVQRVLRLSRPQRRFLLRGLPPLSLHRVHDHVLIAGCAALGRRARALNRGRAPARPPATALLRGHRVRAQTVQPLPGGLGRVRAQSLPVRAGAHVRCALAARACGDTC